MVSGQTAYISAEEFRAGGIERNAELTPATHHGVFPDYRVRGSAGKCFTSELDSDNRSIITRGKFNSRSAYPSPLCYMHNSRAPNK
ncbi:hypothetical protein ABIA45_007266 [Bradyrhizobium sp. USDA 336]